MSRYRKTMREALQEVSSFEIPTTQDLEMITEDIPAELPPGGPDVPRYKNVSNAVVDKEDKKAEKAKKKAEKDVLIPPKVDEKWEKHNKERDALVKAVAKSPKQQALAKKQAAQRGREKESSKKASKQADASAAWLKHISAQKKDAKKQDKDPVGKQHETYSQRISEPVPQGNASGVGGTTVFPEIDDGVTKKEVAPPGWGHTKAEKSKTDPDKPKSKIGGSAHEFDKDLKSGKFKGLPGDKTMKDKKASMFKLMWSMKNKGDTPRYKPGEKGVKKESKLPKHLSKFLDRHGNPNPEAQARIDAGRKKRAADAAKAKIKDVTPPGYGPKEEVELAIMSLDHKEAPRKLKITQKGLDALRKDRDRPKVNKTQVKITKKGREAIKDEVEEAKVKHPDAGVPLSVRRARKKKSPAQMKRDMQHASVLSKTQHHSGTPTIGTVENVEITEFDNWDSTFKAAGQTRPRMSYKDAEKFINEVGFGGTEKKKALKAAKKWLK